MSEVTDLCGRCPKELHGFEETEWCWWCEGPLCKDCWENFGHCGHPEADEANRDLQNARTHAERARIMMRPGPIGGTKDRPKKH